MKIKQFIGTELENVECDEADIVGCFLYKIDGKKAVGIVIGNGETNRGFINFPTLDEVDDIIRDLTTVRDKVLANNEVDSDD